jgi:hypothetical protein
MPAASTIRLATLAVFAIALCLWSASPSSAAVNLPDKTVVEKVDFERHVMGLFGRMGCNGGGCHGSFQGKGGFRLTLFGYDPEKDFQAVVRDTQGRRINVNDPDSSLLLLKATGQVEHGGGVRFGVGSWQYQVIREWIAGGAPRNRGAGEVTAVITNPPEYAFRKAGEQGQLVIKARFTDGSEQNITAFCDFRTNDDAVADVNSFGQVRSLRPGDTAIVVSYRGNVLPVRVMVPVTLSVGAAYPKGPEVNYVDREVFAKLRKLNIIPSQLSSDSEFLRRVYIDTIGSLPTPDEVRAFLADTRSDKRERKIDELLQHPLHAAVWATKFSDITGNNTDALELPQQLRPKRSQMWHDWLRKRFADNMPYDEIVKGILTATSRDGQTVDDWVQQTVTIHQEMDKGFNTSYPNKPTLDLFWKRQQPLTIDVLGEKTAAAFMGVRLECAQCHKHPFDRWTQSDYRAYANLFGRVIAANAVSPDARKAVAEANTKIPTVGNNANQNVIREVYLGDRPQVLLRHPDTNAALDPKAPAGPVIRHEDHKDAREALWQWLRQPDNPFFARSFVNRVWGHYFGIGIVDPVDNFSLGNPPSNEKLLDALAKDFIEHKFDIRHIERVILNSRTYQLSSDVNETNKLDKNNYSHAYIRPMMAEVVIDVLNSALGTIENFGPEAPPNSRTVEVGSSRFLNNPTMSYALRIFGRPPRTTACDCERSADPALPQKLFLMTDTSLITKLNAANGRVRNLVSSNKSDDEVLEEMFLATLTRYPTKEDKELFAEYRSTRKDRQSAFTDAMWALINTREFILNH